MDAPYRGTGFTEEWQSKYYERMQSTQNRGKRGLGFSDSTNDNSVSRDGKERQHYYADQQVGRRRDKEEAYNNRQDVNRDRRGQQRNRSPSPKTRRHESERYRDRHYREEEEEEEEYCCGRSGRERIREQYDDRHHTSAGNSTGMTLKDTSEIVKSISNKLKRKEQPNQQQQQQKHHEHAEKVFATTSTSSSSAAPKDNDSHRDKKRRTDEPPKKPEREEYKVTESTMTPAERIRARIRQSLNKAEKKDADIHVDAKRSGGAGWERFDLQKADFAGEEERYNRPLTATDIHNRARMFSALEDDSVEMLSDRIRDFEQDYDKRRREINLDRDDAHFAAIFGKAPSSAAAAAPAQSQSNNNNNNNNIQRRSPDDELTGVSDTGTLLNADFINNLKASSKSGGTKEPAWMKRAQDLKRKQQQEQQQQQQQQQQLNQQGHNGRKILNHDDFDSSTSSSVVPPRPTTTQEIASFSTDINAASLPKARQPISFTLGSPATTRTTKQQPPVPKR